MGIISILISFNLAFAGNRPGSVFENPEDGQADVQIRLDNDKAGGDDYAYTHGSYVSTGTQVEDLYIEINMHTALYTELAAQGKVKNSDGTYDEYLYFTEENAIRVLITNLAQDKNLYWRVGLGWVQLNSEKEGNILTATGQQVFVHRLIASYNAQGSPHPIYLADGLGIRESYEISAALGLQKEVNLGEEKMFRLRGQLEFGGAQSGLSDADYLEVIGRADLFYQKYPSKFSYRAGFETQVREHADGTEAKAGVVLGVGGKRWTTELRADKVLAGDIHNYQTYNIDDGDIIYSIAIRRKFGKPRIK